MVRTMVGNEAYRQWGVDPKNERSSLPRPGVLRLEGACLLPVFLLGALFLLFVDVAESEALFKFQLVGVAEGGGQDGCRDLARTALELGSLFGRAAAAGHRVDKIRKGHNQKDRSFQVFNEVNSTYGLSKIAMKMNGRFRHRENLG